MSQYISVSIQKNNINYVGYDKKGKKFAKKIKFKPSIFVESNVSDNKIKTLYGKGTKQIKFESIKEYKEYVYKNRHSDIHGAISPIYQFIQTLDHNEVKVQPKVWAIDIEVVAPVFPTPEDVKYPINSVSVHDFKSGEFYQLSLKDYDKYKNNVDVDPEKIKFKKCENEVELLETLVSLISKGFPDILVGWYSNGFDFPYIIKRCISVLGKEKTNEMSPFNSVSCTMKKKMDRLTRKEENYFISKIDGISLLDYKEIFEKYGSKRKKDGSTLDNLKLDTVATFVLGESKVDYSEFDNLTEMWIKSPQKYTDYNIVDTKLIKGIDDDTNLLSLLFSQSYKAKCNFVDIFGTVKPWDTYIYNELLSYDVCVPPNKNKDKEPYPGAYIREPKSGLYDENASVDAKSLYPNIIIECNMSPETFVENKSVDVDQEDVDERFLSGEIVNEEEDLTLSASGNYFRKNKKGYIPTILERLYNERISVQKKIKILSLEYDQNKDKLIKIDIEKLEIESLGIKLFMNSLYGAFANRHFRYYRIEIARSITLTGRLSIKCMEKIIEEHKDIIKYKLSVIFVHTDSCYINFAEYMKIVRQGKTFTDKQTAYTIDHFIKNKLDPVIKNEFELLAKNMNFMENRIWMERECISRAGIWTGKGKYCLYVIDDGGIVNDKPVLKPVGIHLVSKSTPDSIKPFLRNILTNIFEKEDILKYIKNCKKEYLKLTPAEIAFPRGANDFPKWYQESGIKKGTPIGVRSAFIYNRYVDKKNIESSYTKIQSGDKIKFLYLLQPNVLDSNAIGFLRRLPEDLHKYVDYETMWEKSFMSVVRSICDKIDVSYEHTIDLNELF